MVMGTNTSTRSPSVIPSNPSGATPTTSSEYPFTTRVRPTTPGSEPRRFSQNRWLTTATGASPGARSSAGPMSRPSAGRSWRTGK
jgi:hypothetical protein